MITLSVFQVLICLAMGVGLGFCGGLLGIGGGLIAIPVLGHFFNMPQPLAQGTVLIMIIPNVLISFFQYRRRNRIDAGQTVRLCVISSIAAFIAAGYASRLDAVKLQYLFSLFLFSLSGYYLFQILFARKMVRCQLPGVLLPLLGVISGMTSGLFTVGGALVVVPLLVACFSFSQTQAQGTALALVVPGALAALISYALAGNVAWHIGIPLALGGVASVSWGVAVAHRLPPRALKSCFCLVLIGVALSMLNVR